MCAGAFFVQLGEGACPSVLLEIPTLDDWIYRVQYSSWHWKSRIVVSFSGTGWNKMYKVVGHVRVVLADEKLCRILTYS